MTFFKTSLCDDLCQLVWFTVEPLLPSVDILPTSGFVSSSRLRKYPVNRTRIWRSSRSCCKTLAKYRSGPDSMIGGSRSSHHGNGESAKQKETVSVVQITKSSKHQKLVTIIFFGRGCMLNCVFHAQNSNQNTKHQKLVR